MGSFASSVRLAACAAVFTVSAADLISAYPWPSRTADILTPAADPHAQGSVHRVLYANRDYIWPGARNNRIDINVCWENPGSTPGATAAERARWRDVRRRAAEEWARHARINFYGWDGDEPVNRPTACAANAPGMRIVICNLPRDSRCPALPASQAVVRAHTSGMKNGVRLNPTHDVGVIVHEFGHSLGFYHEEERPDAPAISSGPCAKQQYPNARPVTYGAYDKHSIMSYCASSEQAPWLSSNDVAAVQRFYGRRNVHSLVTPRAKCAASHHAVGSGDPAFLWECDEANRDQAWIANALSSSAHDEWSFHIVGVNKPSPWCLVAASASAGAAVRLGPCSGSGGWRFENMSLAGFGGLCLDLQAGNATSGTPIQTWTCGALDGANQRWTRTRAGQIRYRTTTMCAAIATDGRLRLAQCSTADKTQLFGFGQGDIRRLDGNRCLQVPSPSDAQYTSGSGLPTSGTVIQDFACNGSLNQKWSFSGPVRFGTDARLCLTRDVDARGSALTLAQCRDDAESQVWDYHF